MATIHDFLKGSPSARSVAHLSMGGAGSITIWENCHDRISYETPHGNVFSCYLQGGSGTRRVDGGLRHGEPGSVCVMPQGQTSEWEITAPFRFVHLYLPEEQLRSAFARIHDCDARQLQLPEMTFAEAPELALALAQLAQAAERRDILQGEAAAADLIGSLSPRRVSLKSGLPRHQLRRIDDWLEAHLDQPVRLEDLAALTGLSPFHLHRMFRLTRGVTLHAWVTDLRIARARRLMAGPSSLIAIADACGFSGQSHFTRVFKACTGITPDSYRRLATGTKPRTHPAETRDLGE